MNDERFSARAPGTSANGAEHLHGPQVVDRQASQVDAIELPDQLLLFRRQFESSTQELFHARMPGRPRILGPCADLREAKHCDCEKKRPDVGSIVAYRFLSTKDHFILARANSTHLHRSYKNAFEILIGSAKFCKKEDE
jgi:hypothetical protein